jgi:hypothetical protein
MIPLPWSTRTGCSASLHTYRVTETGHDIVVRDPVILLPTLFVLALAVVAPFLALRVARLTCLIVDAACFSGLFVLSGLVALKMWGPWSDLLPAGEAVLATLLGTTVDAFVALVTDAGTDPSARAPPTRARTPRWKGLEVKDALDASAARKNSDSMGRRALSVLPSLRFRVRSAAGRAPSSTGERVVSALAVTASR